MTTLRALCFALLAATLPPAPAPAQTPAGNPLRLVAEIPLPDVAGPFGRLSADPVGGRLYVAARGNGTVEVIDLATDRPVARIENLVQPQGILAVPDLGRLFVTNAGSGTLQSFDLTNPELPLLDTRPLGANPDRIVYDPLARRLLVGYGSGATGAIGLIEADTLEQAGEIGLTGHPEGFAIEQAGARLYINVPTQRNVAVADRTSLALSAAWPLENLSDNDPMTLDEPNQRLFVGCRTPARMVVFDTGGRMITSLGLDNEVGTLSYDRLHSRIYAVCGQGVIDVINQQSPDDYSLVVAVRTAPGARTALFVPERNRLYVAAPRQSGQPARILVFEPQP